MMSSSSRLKSCAGLAAAAFGIGLLAVGQAHAFSLQDSNGSTTDPRQRYLNLDGGSSVQTDRSAGFGQGQTNTVKQGDLTVQFGRQPSFNERYSTDHYFDPLGKPPGVR
jgi:hypothetical protein